MAIFNSPGMAIRGTQKNLGPCRRIDLLRQAGLVCCNVYKDKPAIVTNIHPFVEDCIQFVACIMGRGLWATLVEACLPS